MNSDGLLISERTETIRNKKSYPQQNLSVSVFFLQYFKNLIRSKVVLVDFIDDRIRNTNDECIFSNTRKL